MADGRARGKAAVWPPEGLRRRARAVVGAAGHPWFAAGGRALGGWLAAEAGAGRLVPWLPVGFGLGIVLYFTADHEPLWGAPVGLTLACVAAAVALRRRAVAFPVLVGAAAVAAGFSSATLTTLRIAHPVLARTTWNVELSGFVVAREERERSDRVVVAVHEIKAPRGDVVLERLRVSVRKGLAPPVGTFVRFKARLSPPLSPLRPGGYDFARDLYFQRIGATGFVTGTVTIADPPSPPGAGLRFAAAIERLRDAIDRRIRAELAGDRGAIASALITGKRDAISAPVNDAMYVSSLAHVLSISGYHMAVVAGVVFFAVRGLLALSATLALRRPIKKWAALAALAAATFYLALSGAEVATQRSYVMTAIVLIGVVIDRPALTLRTLGTAALGVLVLAPQAVVHPSFQMSFAATLALVAAYERGLSPGTKRDTSLGARLALWGVHEAAGLVVASLVAGAATTLYAAYHFHRLAPYGVIANLFAMPVVSAFVMPAGIAGMVALPFGFDAPMWRLMGAGIDWMVAVALWVAHLPGAVGRMAAFGAGPLLLATAGLLVLCMLRSPLRWSGAALAVLAVAWAVGTPQPDVLVAQAGDAVAVRGPDGRLAVMRAGGDGFAVRDWLAADGDVRTAGDRTLGDGARCDPIGCAARLTDGRYVALARTAEAVAEDCRRAAIVVTTRTAPPGCAALAVDRPVWQRHGAHALTRDGAGWRIDTARPKGLDRPWAPAAAEAGAAPATPAARRPAPDATPRIDDLSPGDAGAGEPAE